VVTAVPQDQWRLLDVQAHDTRLGQIAHRRRTLPEHAELERLAERARATADELVAARTRAADVGRELAKAESDVEQVRSRASRNKARLDAGQGAAKDLQAIQHELDSLQTRQSILEDVELEVMERAETAAARIAEIEAAQAALTAEQDALVARRDNSLAALDAEAAVETMARAGAVAGLPADLLALYERVREHNAGVGAARLYQRRCDGCRLELTATELGRLRNAAPDEVLRCEECGRILVRTPDSGL